MLIKKAKKYHCISVALLFVFLPHFAHALDGDTILLTNKTTNGITITFTVPEIKISTIKQDGKTFTAISFDGSSPTGRAGEPQIPAQAVPIGVPLDGNITYSIIEEIFEEIPVNRLAPIPQLIKDETGAYLEKYVPNDSIYNSAGVYPASSVEITEPAFFRDQRFVKVIFKPVQYLPQTQRIKKYSKLTIRLQFTGSAKPLTTGKATPKTESIYKNALHNYEQARLWRKSKAVQKKGLFKRSSENVYYKIIVRQRGIYRVTGELLSQIGVDLSQIDPATLRLYNNGGRELPRSLNTARPDSLIENPIIVNDGNDGSFAATDYFLFFGQGVKGWAYDEKSSRWEHYRNHYTSDNVYWLTFGDGINGKRIRETTSISDLNASEVPECTYYTFAETDTSNPFDSGYYWFNKEMSSISTNVNHTITMPNVQASGESLFRFKLVGASPGVHTFSVTVNGNSLANYSFSGASASYSKIIRLKEYETKASNVLQSGSNTISIRYSSSSETAMGYVDWVEVQYTRSLVAYGDELLIYAQNNADPFAYSVTGFSQNNITILDVSDIWNIHQISPIVTSSSSVQFADSSRAPDGKRYYLFTPSAFRSPQKIEPDVFADLRSPDNSAEYIIITHSDFYDQALQLKSLRETWNMSKSMQTEVVDIAEVYDEFAWGLMDATAIRDFLKYAYENWEGPVQYVLLFGDGDYDYRNKLSTGDKNWIPPYEGTETAGSSNRTTDDWFTYVSGDDRAPDLAIGRITARTAAEAQRIVDKIISYETQPVFSDWRNIVTMVADDELVGGGTGDELIHTEQTENIVETSVPKSFDIKKVYLTEYPAVRSPSISGVIKPAATQALIDQINRGTLILDFVGHGAEQLWSHERVLYSSSDFDKIQNGDKYGFWIAATCNYARWDMINEQSMPEDLLAVEGRGAIGVIGSTREAYSGYNASLNRRFFNKLFENYQSQRNIRPVGEALLLAKLSDTSYDNDERYVILGDPTLCLAEPRNKAYIESIIPDSVKALSVMTVKGRLENENGLWADFNGNVLIKTFDTSKPTTYTSASGRSVNYILPGNVLFRGTATAQNGNFEIQFIVPKDISYGGTNGRISVYFWNEEVDGSGYLNNLPIGGTASGFVDQEGPEITIGLKDFNFADGEFASTNPVLHIEISDSVSGVNIAGDIGHKINLTLDNDTENIKDITEFFNYHTGSYTKGSMEYQLFDLSEGQHEIEIKAWDNSNNSSIAYAEFTVIADEKLELRNVLNYPNPMTNQTDFTFEISRNAEVTIKIYTLAGRLLKTLTSQATANFNAIPWDGRDEDGDELANGIYLYRVVAKAPSSEGEKKIEEIGKLMVMK